jgi:hypothetical protein
MWTLIFPHHEGCTPAHAYEPTREAAMAAFVKSWRLAIGTFSAEQRYLITSACRPAIA